MRITAAEREAIVTVIDLGAAFGYGNLISHLQTAWARTLMDRWGMPEAAARAASGGPGYPFLLQQDLLERGEWDESGTRYRTQAAAKDSAGSTRHQQSVGRRVETQRRRTSSKVDPSGRGAR